MQRGVDFQIASRFSRQSDKGALRLQTQWLDKGRGFTLCFGDVVQKRIGCGKNRRVPLNAETFERGRGAPSP